MNIQLEPPKERDLPRHDEHRAHVLAAIAPRKRWLRPRRALVAFAVTVLALIAVLGSTQFTGGGPATASAQSILRHASALRVQPGRAQRLTYRIRITDAAQGIDSNGTDDVWFEQPSSGAAESAQTLTLSKLPGGNETPWGRYVQIGNDLYGYDVARNEITLPSDTHDVSPLLLPNSAFNSASVAESVQALQRAGGQVDVLDRRTVDGHPVDVIQVVGALDKPALQVKFYFDTETHVLRGFDAVSVDPSYPTPSWQVRLESSSITSAASVPAATFKLRAPDSAVVAPPRLDKQTLLSVCAGFKAKVQAGQSVLAACHAQRPELSEDQLVTELSRPAKAELDAAVAADQITPAQERQSLAWLRDQLLRVVLTPGPPGK